MGPVSDIRAEVLILSWGSREGVLGPEKIVMVSWDGTCSFRRVRHLWGQCLEACPSADGPWQCFSEVTHRPYASSWIHISARVWTLFGV